MAKDKESGAATRQRKSFIYKQNGTSKIFPIDYSEYEITLNTGVGYSRFRKWIMEESPMKNQLKNLVMSKDGETYQPGKNGKKKLPYPVETMPFLECYINLAKEKRYKKVFDRTDRQETRQQFLREFCVRLSTALLPSKEETAPDKKAFARHVLFGNQAFSREVMEDLWESEFDSRVRTLRARARQLPYAEQANWLKLYLMVMDDWVLRLPPPCRLKKSSEPETELQEMFADLLSQRKKEKKEKDGNALAKYRVKNVQFKETKLDGANDLNGAFQILSGLGDSCNTDMLDEIRELYLCDLGNMDAPAFEQEYIAVNDYLTAFPQKDDQIKAYFVEAMKQWGREMIDYCVAVEDSSAQRSMIRNSHVETLLHAAAIQNVNLFWDTIKQTRDCYIMHLVHAITRSSDREVLHRQIQIMQSAKQEATMDEDLCNGVIRCLTAAEQILETGTVVWRTHQIGNFAAYFANAFLRFFESAGVFLGYEEDPFANEKKLKETAEQFTAQSNTAAVFFDRARVFSYTKEQVTHMCEICVEMSSNLEGELSLAGIFESIFPLMLGILLQTFHKIAINSDAETMRNLLMEVHRPLV